MLKLRDKISGGLCMLERTDEGLRTTIECGFVRVSFFIGREGVELIRQFLNDLELETTASTSVTIDEGKIPVDNVTKL